jgi:hypothetical protein
MNYKGFRIMYVEELLVGREILDDGDKLGTSLIPLTPMPPVSGFPEYNIAVVSDGVVESTHETIEEAKQHIDEELL